MSNTPLYWHIICKSTIGGERTAETNLFICTSNMRKFQPQLFNLLMLILLLMNFRGVQIYRVVKILRQLNKILNRLSRIFEISNNCTPNSGPFMWQYGLVLLLPLQLYVLPFKSLHWLQQTEKVIVKLWSVLLINSSVIRLQFCCTNIVTFLSSSFVITALHYVQHKLRLRCSKSLLQQIVLLRLFITDYSRTYFAASDNTRIFDGKGINPRV